MTVIVETADLEGKREILQEQIASALQPDHLEIEDGLAMLAVVGRGMRKMRGTAAGCVRRWLTPISIFG